MKAQMINYEKLKLAEELCQKSKGYYFVSEYHSKRGLINIMLRHQDEYYEVCKDIDHLIDRLKELTEPKPKYEVGQTIYYIFHRAYTTLPPDIEEGEITDFEIIDNEIYYSIKSNKIDELSCFYSVEELINAQITYWQSLKYPDFEGEVNGFGVQESCQHE